MFLLLSLALASPIDQVVPAQGNARGVPVNAVVLHSTGGAACNPAFAFKGGTLSGQVNWFQTRTDGVNIHYVVGEDGTTVAMVPEEQAAAHVYNANSRSIGIEMINDGDGLDPYPAAQQLAMVDLLVDILDRNNLPTSAVTTHGALDQRWVTCSLQPNGSWKTTVSSPGVGQRRRTDPGSAFPLTNILQQVATQREDA
jgi:N-acetylmuramoyl-L-alanine amidase